MRSLLRRRALCCAATLTGAIALLVTSFSGVSAAASNRSTIVIGYITDLTGVASSTFADGAGGAQARIDAQNAAGGVYGHKLKLVVEDDQSSPTLNQTAAQELVSVDNAFGIINFRPSCTVATSTSRSKVFP